MAAGVPVDEASPASLLAARLISPVLPHLIGELSIFVPPQASHGTCSDPHLANSFRGDVLHFVVLLLRLELGAMVAFALACESLYSSCGSVMNLGRSVRPL